MEAEERPSKLRKLSHADGEQELPHHKPLSVEASTNGAGDPNGTLSDEDDSKHFDERAAPPTGDDAEKSSDSESADGEDVSFITSPAVPLIPETSGLTKTQLKKLRKKREWEAGREDRKAVRKEKNKERKARKRAARGAARGAALETFPTSADTRSLVSGQPSIAKGIRSLRPGVAKHVQSTLLPITLVLDCSYNHLMHERELISLASQITRCYSENHRARFNTHLAISSWGGALKERFDTVLGGQYKNWKGVRVLEEDFAEAGEMAKEWMSTEGGGKLTGTFMADIDRPGSDLQDEREVIYLTSDSPHTLTRLKPCSTYIIGGLVDKNRHKGICYKSACDKVVKTAKLPIGEYMEMQSRYVLATNHVVEIMLRWLEDGDWGEAFLGVMPKRKGGRLKERGVELEDDGVDQGCEDGVGNGAADGLNDNEDERGIANCGSRRDSTFPAAVKEDSRDEIGVEVNG
jgi:tRNA (guanine9-N1)-methyltransferase